MQTSKSKEINELRQYHAKKIKEEGNDNLASKVATMQPQDLANLDKVETLADIFPEHKERLLSLYEDVEAVEEEQVQFNIADYDPRQPGVKTEIAMDYSDHLVYNENIRPVVIDGATMFYQYKEEDCVWREVEWEMIKKKAKATLSNFWTRHTRQQFKQSMEDHEAYVTWDKMGLQKNEILMKNGEILDIETMETREAEKKDYALNGVNAVLKEEPEPGKLKEFIQKTFPDEEEQKVLQEFLGFTLKFPSDKYEKALLLLGRTDSGKSTFLEIVKMFYQLANTTKISFPQLGYERAFHVEQLKESVINFDHDMSKRDIKNYSRIKKIISKEEIHADPKMEKGYDMKSQANFIIASNNAPDDDGADEAFYNRFLTVQAPNRVPPEEQDRELVEKLTTEEEMEWMFHWALKGLKRLEENNRFTLERSNYETKKVWTKYGDNVNRFIYEQVNRDVDEGKNIPTSDVYEAYKLWCETQMDDPVSQKAFISRAADHPDMEKKKAMPFDGTRRRMCFKHIEVEDYAI